MFGLFIPKMFRLLLRVLVCWKWVLIWRKIPVVSTFLLLDENCIAGFVLTRWTNEAQIDILQLSYKRYLSLFFSALLSSSYCTVVTITWPFDWQNYIYYWTLVSPYSGDLDWNWSGLATFGIFKRPRVRSFGVIQIRSSDPRSLGSWCIKGTDESMAAFLWGDPDPDQWSKMSESCTSKEPVNPLWSWIHRFLWCTMSQILDHWSGSGSPQRNAAHDQNGFVGSFDALWS